MHGKDGAVKKYVDLHIHTRYSDGECSIRDIMAIAHEKGLSAVSITDHDNIDGYPQAFEIGSEFGIEVISGTELSCEINGVDIHVLGYCVDINNTALRQKLQEMKDARYLRAKKMVRNLNRQNLDLRFETVLKIAGEGAIGRPHIATAMLNEELVYSFKEAFEKYIGYDSAAYVDKLKMLPHEVFTLIRDAGGIPVLAHPGVTFVDEHIPSFIRDGLGGIEVFHSEHNSAAKKFYQEYCRKHDLVVTGGSDFHSQTQTRAEIGVPRISYSVLNKLKNKCEKVHG
ncbi:MAG: PHP domain-containing protein [bacterium]|nr:PHP domain-containing protein [bacterium]